jgi:8-oxo-dGTP pyrophosphatase MutT (NUDIX family)
MKKVQETLGKLLFWLAWPAFWMISPHRPRTRVLLTCSDSVLLVKNFVSTGRWGMPGGGLHRGEDPHEGAVRELFEETGVILAPPQNLALLGKVVAHEYGLAAPTFYFAAELEKPSYPHKQPFEIAAVEWVDRAHLTSDNCTRETRQFLAQRSLQD